MITLLAISPIWLTFVVLFFLCVAILPLGRKYFEGTAYNVSISSEYGEVALIAIILIAAGIIQRQGAPEWLWHYQIIFGVLSIIAGLIDHTLAGWKHQTEMDTYHNLFVVSLLVYLVLFIGLGLNLIYGTVFERVATIVLGMIWIATFIVDLRTGRSRQTKYLREHLGTPTIV